MEYLDNIPKKNSFEVPENYFEDFSIQMRDKISSANSISNRLFSYASVKVKWAWGIAVVLVIVGLGIALFSQLNNKIGNKERWELANVAMLSETDFDEDMLMEAMIEKNKSFEKKNTNDQTAIIDFLMDQNIEDYEVNAGL